MYPKTGLLTPNKPAARSPLNGCLGGPVVFQFYVRSILRNRDRKVGAAGTDGRRHILEQTTFLQAHFVMPLKSELYGTKFSSFFYNS